MLKLVSESRGSFLCKGINLEEVNPCSSYKTNGEKKTDFYLRNFFFFAALTLLEEKPVGFRLKPPTLIHGQAPSAGKTYSFHAVRTS